jgi:hypothetical protein
MVRTLGWRRRSAVHVPITLKLPARHFTRSDQKRISQIEEPGLHYPVCRTVLRLRCCRLVRRSRGANADARLAVGSTMVRPRWFDDLGAAQRAELLRVLLLPDFERARATGDAARMSNS